MTRDTVRNILLRATAVAAIAVLGPGVPLALAAQQAERPGRIKGEIAATDDAAAVQTAQVKLVDTEIGALADMDGRYFLSDVPPGTYDLQVRALGYATKTVTGVTVEPGETVKLDVSLETDAVAVDELTVSVERARSSAAALLDQQRVATAVTDAVGAEQISRSPDSDAAEAARRMTGVTVSEGKFVFIRGLGQRYSQTELNGSPLPSPQPEKSVVPLDLFPAGFIESITTRKTYTPDQSGDFSGGTVQIDTKEFPDYFTFRMSVGSSVNSRSQFADGFLSYAGGGLDFLGIDDGSRDLPADLVGEIGGLDGRRLPSEPAARERLGESFLGTPLSRFTPEQGTTPANLDFGFSVGDRAELLGKTFGYFVAGSYSNEYTFRDDEVERKWRSTDFDPSIPAERRDAANVDYEFVRGMQDVEWGGIANFHLQLSPSHQLSLKTLYNRNAEDEARRYQGANREDLTGILRSERLRFVSREMAWGQLAGKHQFGDHRLEWRMAGARATRDEPGLRETIFRRSFAADEGDPFTLVDTGESARYLFTDLADDDLNGQVDWTAPLPWPGEGNAKVKVGVAGRTRDRGFDARRFRWEFLGGSAITSLDSALHAGSVVGVADDRDEFALTEIVEPGDNYTADDETLAGYAMFTLPLGDLEAVLGARVEDYDLSVETRNAGISTGIEATDVLPALNLTWSLSDRMNLRAAASETVDRPEFRELAPFQFTEAASLRQIEGNPELDQAVIRNFDLRWEFFPGDGEVLTLSGFYKDFDQPIEQVFVAAAGTKYSYQNAREAELYGAELGVRKRLGFLGDVFRPFTFDGNVAVIRSNVKVRTGGIFNPTNLERDLEGQSPYTVNASLLYRRPDGGTEAGVFFNVFGERIVAAGGSGVPDIVEQPRPQLDFTLRQELWRNLSLKLKAENLLDAEHLWEQSRNGVTRVQRRFTEGRSFGLSLSYGGG